MTSPPMSIAIRTIALPRRRTSDFSGAGARMYGRVARTSSAGTGSTGSAGLWRTGRSTRRSYLAGDGDHCVRPVLKRMPGDHALSQLGPDGRTVGAVRTRYTEDRRGERLRVALACDQLEGHPTQERRAGGAGRDDRPGARCRLEDRL